MSLQFLVDQTKCDHCGLCVDDCPARIITYDDAGVPEVKAAREADCVKCQHCLAICPDGAVSVNGVRPENSRPLTTSTVPTFAQMDQLVRARRSVRQYRPEDVNPNLIQRLLDAAAHAPTGVNARQLTFTVIEARATLARLRTQAFDAIAAATEAGHLVERGEFLAKVVHNWREHGRDVIFRDAPHLIIVSSPPTTPCPQQDVSLTLAYFELLAQTAGLGTVWCGYVKVMLEAFPALKPLFGLAPDHVYYAMLFGHCAVQYARTVQREGSAAIRRISSVSA